MHIGSKRKSKGMATEHDVHEAGGQKCVHQNLNIAFVFWILRTSSPANQLITKKIIDFIKGTNAIQIMPKYCSIAQRRLPFYRQYGIIDCCAIRHSSSHLQSFAMHFSREQCTAFERNATADSNATGHCVGSIST